MRSRFLIPHRHLGCVRGAVRRRLHARGRRYRGGARPALDPRLRRGQRRRYDGRCPSRSTCSPRSSRASRSGTSPAGPPQNRLIIRMQRNGNAIQINDTLYVDIPDSFEVARCLRGRTVAGVPDWDTATGTIDPAITTPWCEPVGTGRRSAHPPRPVRPGARVAHAARHVSPDGGRADGRRHHGRGEGRLDRLPRFRLAPCRSRHGARIARRRSTTSSRSAYDDRLHANFQAVLEDDRVVTAMYSLRLPPPPDIGGTLDGFFDFYLRRGRSAQTFP